MKAQFTAQEKEGAADERGQTIVLIVFMIVGILAFAGLAADVGFLFARSSQFSSAVDAAALAGVVDLHKGLDKATGRANEFLDANGWPVANTLNFTGTQTYTDLGLPEFNYTVTWPVETFFMSILGFDEIPVTHSASAAYYAFSDMPTSTMLDRGMVRLGTQFVYGPDSCAAQGDPVSARFSLDGVGNDYYPISQGVYLYRIRVPAEYITDTGQSLVVIQLFDPDSINTAPYWGHQFPVTLSDGSLATAQCNTVGNGDSCVGETGEPDNGNPIWLRRVDEAWRNTSGGNCPDPNFGSPNGNTVTRYELFYRNLDTDERVDLAEFESNVANSAATDMKWITPDYVGADGSFRVDLNNLPLDAGNNYNIYLEVKATAGTSKNGWDIWAAPPSVAEDPNLPAEVNLRNLYILENYGSFDPREISIYGQGHLPLTVYRQDERVKVPVAAVDAIQGGGTIYASVFDFDPVANDPFYFTFDTIAPGDFRVDRAALCEPNNSTDCNNKWVEPQYAFGIPINSDGIAFYGGYLLAEYEPNYDEHVWSLRTTSGRAFLTR